MPNLITEENLGAWLIKCDPDRVFDLPRAIAEGLEVVTEWSVRRGYRADMMRKGQRIVLWVSGSGARMERGIWGTGFVAGDVDEDNPNDHDAAEIGFWFDEEARRSVELFVPCDIPIFGVPLAAEDILAVGIDDLEVQRMPAGSNPSWISAEQLERLDALLEWPEDDGYDEQITVSDEGAGFGDPMKNAVVEAAAMAAVIQFYGEDWTYDNVSAAKIGWDLTFTNIETGAICKVEVKGVSSSRPSVLLTANEIRAADEEGDWYLAVVTRALSDPNVVEYTAEQAIEAARPYVYRAEMSQA